MTVQELIEALQQIPYPESMQVVVRHQGIRGVIGSTGGASAKVVSAYSGFDWDSGFVFLTTDKKLTLVPEKKKPRKHKK